jgi:2'-5' RNA ligase
VIRAFVALELPEGVRRELAGLQKQLAEAGKGVKWVRPEGIHLTLKFLGSVEEDRIEAITQAMEAAAASCGALRLKLKGVGAFPGLARPRVVWVGLVGDTERLGLLQRELETRLAALGWAPEARPFAPHLTLGRVKEPVRGKSPLAEAILRLSGVEPEGDFEAAELVLFRSELKPGGAVYTKLRSVRLRGA